MLGTITLAKAPDPEPEQYPLHWQYVSASNAVPDSPIVHRAGDVSNSCLASLQNWRKDFPRGVGYPNNIAPLYQLPSVGLAVLTTEGPVGHVALIERVDDDVIVVYECNYHAGSCGYREIKKDSTVIRGYR